MWLMRAWSALRAVMSSAVPYHRMIRPPCVRRAKARTWNQQYEPSATRMRYSTSYGSPVSALRAQRCHTEGWSSGWVNCAQPSRRIAASSSPVSAASFGLTSSRWPRGSAVHGICGLTSTE